MKMIVKAHQGCNGINVKFTTIESGYEDPEQARPGRSGKDTETGCHTDDAADQMDPAPGAGARRDQGVSTFDIGTSVNDAGKALQ